MTPEAYVIGSIVFSVMVVAILYSSSWSTSTDEWSLYWSAEIMDEIKESLRCPRCGAQMESVGSGVGCLGAVYYVVPPILVLKCPHCGYEERSW